jgi:CheY-like chemotaxis protein
MSKSHLNLLIVEDEAATRYLLTQIFTLRGFTVRSAEDGFAALQMIRSTAPEILLSDLNMPGMSGFELLSVVRRLYPEIHVIATSGAYSGTSVPHGIAADGFHEKASGMATLLDLLDLATILGTSAFYSHRSLTPLWISLEARMPFESNHVFLNCPACLRPFRQTVEEINAEIRETTCRFCGGRVDYAIALAVKPTAAATEPQASITESPLAAHPPTPIASQPRPTSTPYSHRTRNALRA